VKGLKSAPLLGALATCVLFAFFGSALVGEGLGGWYEGLEKPWFLVPLWVFYVVAVLYYLAFATVLYRTLVHVEDRSVRGVCLALTLVVMLSNELWNYLFFGLRSTLAGFVGIALFLVPLTDLAWTFELWRLNGGA